MPPAPLPIRSDSCYVHIRTELLPEMNINEQHTYEELIQRLSETMADAISEHTAAADDSDIVIDPDIFYISPLSAHRPTCRAPTAVPAGTRPPGAPPEKLM